MSDSEEPAFKIVKLQNTEQGEEMEEGQEEWLSEDVLTDEDYNPTAENEQSDYANMSHEDTMPSMNDSMDNHNHYHDTGDSNAQDGHENDPEGNIEEALNNLETSQDKEFPEELGAFLIRKTDGRMVQKEQTKQQEERQSEADQGEKHSDDDGHDTDELLRMLGDDGIRSKKKQVLRSVRERRREESSDDEDDDDEYIFEEMPSSESEDLDEWFTLDIRAERAGDYLPLLGEGARRMLGAERQRVGAYNYNLFGAGEGARRMLGAERQRVGARLATLRQSLSALTESGRQQAEQLRAATATLAELDAALKAA
ncbi:unnamed protein product, partial [Iphiclides podalirius]